MFGFESASYNKLPNLRRFVVKLGYIHVSDVPFDGLLQSLCNWVLPVVPHKAVAEVSRIGNV